MCGQHNVRISAEDKTGQNTGKGHTPNPRTKIKIPYPAGNRTRAAGLEGRDSTDHAMATDNMKIESLKLFIIIEKKIEFLKDFLEILSLGTLWSC